MQILNFLIFLFLREYDPKDEGVIVINDDE